jgi:ADP-heptose:LPS heptosyltransferase
MKLPQEHIRKIIIFRALQLGDLLCSIPAFRALRRAYPDARITIAGMPWMKMLVERFPNYFDEFIWFPGFPGLPEQKLDPWATADFLKRVTEQKFDLALQMQGNGSIVNPMVELFGAKYTAGYYTEKDYCPDRELFMIYPEGISEIRKHLRLMEHLGIPLQGEDMEFPVTGQDENELRNALAEISSAKYICVHPGSRGSWRQWPTEYFANLADYCSEHGWKIVLTGTNDEMPIINEVTSKMHSKPIIAAGKTSLGAMGALLKNADGLISNCTGVSHVAAALKTKSVVISMDGEPERWAPLNKNIHSTIDWTRTPDFSLVKRAVDERFLKAS